MGRGLGFFLLVRRPVLEGEVSGVRGQHPGSDVGVPRAESGGVRSEVGRAEAGASETSLESGLGPRAYGAKYLEVTSLCFFPQGERGVKGACGLDGEKGDKVRR